MTTVNSRRPSYSQGSVFVLPGGEVPANRLRFAQINTKSPRFHVHDYATGLPIAGAALGVVAACAGVGIGAVSTLLGVAGGELIIPTLVIAFGVPIKAAGTMSLLISIPTMLVGLARHRARGVFQRVSDVGRVVLPMAAGTVLGSAVGGLLVVYTPARAASCSWGACWSGRRCACSRRRTPLLHGPDLPARNVFEALAD